MKKNVTKGRFLFFFKSTTIAWLDISFVKNQFKFSLKYTSLTFLYMKQKL